MSANVGLLIVLWAVLIHVIFYIRTPRFRGSSELETSRMLRYKLFERYIKKDPSGVIGTAIGYKEELWR